MLEQLWLVPNKSESGSNASPIPTKYRIEHAQAIGRKARRRRDPIDQSLKKMQMIPNQKNCSYCCLQIMCDVLFVSGVGLV